jgi:hypothetical protein
MSDLPNHEVALTKVAAAAADEAGLAMADALGKIDQAVVDAGKLKEGARAATAAAEHAHRKATLAVDAALEARSALIEADTKAKAK